MASEIEKAADFIRRLGPARAEAARLLAEAAEGAGVWMHNLTNGARTLVRHEDTLARLITEGWSHIAPVFLEPDNPTPPAPSTPEAADVASLPETSLPSASVSETTPAPSQEPTETSEAPESGPSAKGKKA